MKVTFYYGKTGSAKTLNAVYDAFVDRLRGRRVFSNLKSLRIPQCVYVSPSNMIRALNPNLVNDSTEILLNSKEPKTLILDEISKWWDSRRHADKKNQYLAYFIDQSRKRNINLIVVDQHIGGFDLRGRQHVDKLIRCMCEYEPNTIDTNKPIPLNFHCWVSDLEWGRAYKFYTPAKALEPFYDLYDTYEHIVPTDMIEEDLQAIAPQIA